MADSCFQCDPDFCPECGTILVLPGPEDYVVCRKCDFKISVRKFEGMEIHSEMVFNNPDVMRSNLAAENEDGDLKGPVVDRKCSRCGHEGMVYHTRQTRSADEGQTVFYTCTSCRYQEKEDS
ncbi:DNA-directed RNA polymerase I subunit RPA12 [Chiloscyllium plagiosum]|uniref:DNA-directed RNA polymerase I subunit RPA12 n=1 Tax=Chiloscyllium plagiosum TaxID=36176 RepID=UPI001CB80760|nr:DNA-directed RNA polymerase I subunit RPA12 [Chiloscyllium plagiosum]XP_043533971.1 DNA-directed RNA polymerase I subunit RPA12 [Chiloscyllium plagiosum]XP_043533972.1 DNA-directed RNA polymerase I subunit RPA12 [Chiloscyllium plagiosum]